MHNESDRWVGRNPAKDELREQIWSALESAGAVDGDPRGSIPDFEGADRAAARLASLDIWKQATVIKCTPDACQAPIRLRALQEGKLLYMAYPQLVVYPCFLELDAAELTRNGVAFETASTMEGAIEHGRLVPFDEMRHIDIVNVGSVAVTPAGGRTGKGAGFADLELALLRDAGLVDESTAICTTVHPLSVVDDALLPMTPTDSTVDYIVTETETLRATSPQSGPTGIQWDLLEADQIESIPILAMLNAARTPGSAE
ncbi:MAG: 5-formyltetrahydrofolate cyclo-ligase [Leifsonia sp.]|nr:5-formyltetrahydrofolate cyclo-ligase [Leifsonia sp.]|tara:strand:+ start:160029 stop:160802 length:774 start_codon:yes stop_codon:yes gene_type:complete